MTKTIEQLEAENKLLLEKLLEAEHKAEYLKNPLTEEEAKQLYVSALELFKEQEQEIHALLGKKAKEMEEKFPIVAKTLSYTAYLTAFEGQLMTKLTQETIHAFPFAFYNLFLDIFNTLKRENELRHSDTNPLDEIMSNILKQRSKNTDD